MNDTYHDQLTQLRVISQVKASQSLNISGSEISIYEFTIFDWLMRKFNRITKREVVDKLADIYKSIDRTASDLIRQINTTRDLTIKNERIKTARDYINNIRASIIGLDNLYQTYKEYSFIKTKIEGIAKDYALNTYISLLNVVYCTLPTDDIIFNNKVIYGANYEPVVDFKLEERPAAPLQPTRSTALPISVASPQSSQSTESPQSTASQISSQSTESPQYNRLLIDSPIIDGIVSSRQ